jgi:hypothetical protein
MEDIFKLNVFSPDLLVNEDVRGISDRPVHFVIIDSGAGRCRSPDIRFIVPQNSLWTVFQVLTFEMPYNVKLSDVYPAEWTPRFMPRQPLTRLRRSPSAASGHRQKYRERNRRRKGRDFPLHCFSDDDYGKPFLPVY